MSWADIFYPGNPGRRDQVVASMTKFKTLMEFNFDATNDLIDIVNKYVVPSPPIRHIHVNQTASIRDNADTLITKMNEVQDIIDNIDKKIAESLEPEIYKQLTDPDTHFSKRIAAAKEAVSATIGVVATVAGVVLVGLIRGGYFLKGMVASLGLVKTSAIASLGLAVIALGIDMIASAIIGAVERNKLEDTIDQFEEALAVFEPASKEYTKTITRAEIRLEILLEND